MTDAREQWNGIWGARAHPTVEPDPWIEEIASLLPDRGRAIDLAGGAGRHAVWLAARGLNVTLVDISEAALTLARDAADARGLTLTCMPADLEADGPPPGRWDVAVIAHFLHRPLLEQVDRLLEPGGKLVVVHPTRTNLERHPKPSARFLLEDDELRTLLPSSLHLERYEEGWTDAGVHHARLVAQR
ncbi:MAG: class I SAM-dependent methyltransferase [Proteobacteria bacterium]|nr:class I SAM-dependent methyltransferase [Pseudomonadota bacterium]